MHLWCCRRCCCILQPGVFGWPCDPSRKALGQSLAGNTQDDSLVPADSALPCRDPEDATGNRESQGTKPCGCMRHQG